MKIELGTVEMLKRKQEVFTDVTCMELVSLCIILLTVQSLVLNKSIVYNNSLYNLEFELVQRGQYIIL